MELDDLYQEVLLDHYRHPRHCATLCDDETLADAENPLCGDRIRLSARLAGDRLTDVRVDCQGCAICTASASMMAEAVSGQPVAAVRRKLETFLGVLRGETAGSDTVLGDLAALRGVAKFPMRMKCATLPWHALNAALQRLAGT
jgi:nitrogen fixation NifU-like protein